MIGAPLSILCVAARPARKKALRTRGRCSFPAGRTCGTIRTFMPTLLKGRKRCVNLTNYYSRALKKERGREHLLKQELGMDKVVHYVVSRFPVIGADAAVINYNQIERLRPAGRVGA